MQRPLIRIVDDDKALAGSFGLLLETMGWDTAAYTSGRRFLNNDDLSRPGCIVLDVRMPGLTGPEIQDKLIEMGCRLPIIFLSAHGSIPTAVSAVQKGAVDFLEKPIEPAELIAKINAAVARSVTESVETMHRDRLRARFETLTAREREIIGEILKGDGSETNKQIAVTILKTIGSLHRFNVLVGDVNLSNIRVVSPDEAYLVDCDSVQVANLPCPVGHEMYTAPEIRGRDFSTFLRSKSSENHAVAALIFMLLMPDEDLDESGKYRLGARRISSDPFLLDYPGFHRGEPLTLCRRARIWSHLPDDLKSAFGRTFDSRGNLHAEADRLGVAGWILRLNAYRERLLDGTLLADDPLANEIYPKTGRKILPPARPACVVCGRPHDETDGRNGVCSACISIAERVLARTTVRAAGTPAPSAPKSEPKASGPETAASEDKPSDTAYERTCVDCGSLFRITKGEAEHLRNLGYRLPARCKACRAERRARKKAIERRSDEDGSILDEILNGVRDLIKPLA